MIRIHQLVSGTLETLEAGAPVGPPPAGVSAWFDVVAPTPEECAVLREKLGLHELALEDALRIGHPPKLEDFEEHLFVIAHTPVEDAEEGTRKISIFLAKTWIVTVLRAPLERLAGLTERVQRRPEHYLKSPAVLAHRLLDDMTDGFERRVEELVERVDALDEPGDPNPETMTAIVEMRQESVGLSRVVRSQRDMCALLAHSTHAALPKRVQPYLRDVYDHLLRVYDHLDGVREGLGAARDAYLAAVNNRLSEVMRVLTVIATIMMPLSLIAGVFGMNFEVMPGVRSPAGFWLAMGGMLLIAAGMLYFFRHRRWL
jgi:magnesium transporter